MKNVAHRSSLLRHMRVVNAGVIAPIVSPIPASTCSVVRQIPSSSSSSGCRTFQARLMSNSATDGTTTRTDKSATATAAAGGIATEKITGTAEKHTFQAETKQLLNIVANSLYTDKHVFIRELVSNASDALEKLRHMQVAGESISDGSRPLAIRITTNDAENTITFSDTGVGMDHQELMDNLGTIARSGSKAFMQRLRSESGTTTSSSASSLSNAASQNNTGANIIGQFGVGFYSSFMVAETVTVYTQSAKPNIPGYAWTSVGDGSYNIAPATDVIRGCKIVLKLKDTCRDFSNASTVKDIITRYSNFVNFPIYLNDKQVNTVSAIWTSSKAEVTEEQYTEFYKYKSGDFESPLYKLHFSSDAPTSIKALLYVGNSHDEKYGMGRMKCGVDLYSRKVLIQANSTIVPDWLRFVHGVVDSEDIPLNISRESMQDSALLKRIRAVITRRILRFLDAEARRDQEAYSKKFFPEFGTFLKEGAVTDQTYAQDLAKLLRFESSAQPSGTSTSFDEYISRMPVGQQAIYYLVAPHRGIAEASPYMEAFKAAKGAVGDGASNNGSGGGGGGVEVLFLYSPIDDFVMNNLREYGGRKLLTAETAELDPETLQGINKKSGNNSRASSDASGKKDETSSSASSSTTDGKKSDDASSSSSSTSAAVAAVKLTDAQVTELGSWMVTALPARLSKVRSTARLRSSPAVITDHESASMRRMMRMVEASAGKEGESLRLESHMLPKQTLEINPSHPVIVRLHSIRETSPDLAKAVSEQIVDNAMVAAGLVDDARVMLPRLNALLERALGLSWDPSTNAGTSGFTSAEDLAKKRYVPPREAQERSILETGEAAANAAVEALKKGAGAEMK